MPDTFTPIPLTAAQIAVFDEIAADVEGAEKTLRVAMNFHSNLVNEAHKRSQQHWRDLASTHLLDLTNTVYKTELVGARVCIVEADNG